MEKLRLLCFLLGVIGPGGGTLLFIGLPNRTSLAENQLAGTVVYTFSVNSTFSLLVSPKIINSNPLTSAFRIDNSPPNYLVVTTGSPVLDFETTPNSFDIQIYMKGNTNATNLQTLTVQLTNVNEPPVFLNNLANQIVIIYIEEGTAQGPIYTILASDPEDATSALKYSLTPASASFTVSPTGIIVSTKTFDYETDPHSYSFTVTVTDSAGLSVNGTLTVMITNINDGTPYFNMTSTTFTIPEEQYPGTVVTTITAVDPDAAGFISKLYYSINTPNQYFSINELTGVIQIAKRIDVDASTLRLNSAINLEIQVRDLPSAGNSNKITITINILDINDNPPVCTTYAFSQSVPETAVNGTLIMDLSNQCKDNDVDPINKAFNFTGLSGLGTNQRFQLIPAGSGKIVLTGNLDFEDPNNIGVGNEYSLKVAVGDIAFPYYKEDLYVYIKTIPVNEYSPVFNSSSYVFSVSELSPPQSVIGYIYATDQDYPYIGITYTIESGGSTLGATSIFWINPNTGVLMLSDYADYETTQQYILTVKATDSGSKFSTVSVTVNILEANDEKPVCTPNSYTLSVPVNQATGTNIQNFKLTCTDRDSGPQSFQYFINSGNINNHFAFSPSSGSNVSNLILALPFDYSEGGDTTWNYNLRVLITDGNLISKSLGGPVQTGTVSLFINVYIPGPTTTRTTTTPSVVYVVTSENVYSPLAWYIPFVSTIGALLLLGFLGALIYLLAKYFPCRRPPKPDTDPLIKPPEKKVKQDVFWEMTKFNTVFDGEAVDPITGNVYEYNSKSGARRWKDTKQPIIPVPVSQQLPMNPTEQTSLPVLSSGTPTKKVKTPANAAKAEDVTNSAVPGTPNRLQTPKQPTPNMESENKSPHSRSPMSPRHSPKVSPKIPKTPA